MRSSCKNSSFILVSSLLYLATYTFCPASIARPDAPTDVNAATDVRKPLYLAQESNQDYGRRNRASGSTDGVFNDGSLVRGKAPAANPGTADNQQASPAGASVMDGSPQGRKLRRKSDRQNNQEANSGSASNGTSAGDSGSPPGPSAANRPGGFNRFTGANGTKFGGDRFGANSLSGPGFGKRPLDLSLLNLTEQQKEKIRQLHTANGVKAKDLRKNLMTSRGQLRDMMFDPAATDDQIRAKRHEIWEMQGQVEEAQLNDFLSIRSMLNTEQRQKLSELKPGPQFAGAPGRSPSDGPAAVSGAGAAAGQ